MKNNFPDNIRKLRKSHRLTQEEFGEVLLINRTSIGHYERGVAFPYIGTLIRLVQKYEINLHDMIFKELEWETTMKVKECLIPDQEIK